MLSADKISVIGANRFTKGKVNRLVLPGNSGNGIPLDANAAAFISAHEAQTSTVMGLTQQLAINGFVKRLKGIGTTNGSDIWSILTATKAVLMPYCPSSDSVASFNGYKIDLLNPANFGTFTNMVSGDISVNGITGGITKFLDMTVAPVDFDIDNIGVDFYSRTTIQQNATIAIGSHSGTNQNSIGFSVYPSVAALGGLYSWRANTNTDVGGAKASGENAAFYSFQITPTGLEVYKNSVIQGSPTATQTGRSTLNFYAHASNSSSGAFAPDTVRQYAGFCVRPSLSSTEMADYYEAWDFYQTNVITGGRNV